MSHPSLPELTTSLGRLENLQEKLLHLIEAESTPEWLRSSPPQTLEELNCINIFFFSYIVLATKLTFHHTILLQRCSWKWAKPVSKGPLLYIKISPLQSKFSSTRQACTRKCHVVVGGYAVAEENAYYLL